VSGIYIYRSLLLACESNGFNNGFREDECIGRESENTCAKLTSTSISYWAGIEEKGELLVMRQFGYKTQLQNTSTLQTVHAPPYMPCIGILVKSIENIVVDYAQ
jgi:hypothetical protein